MKDKLIQIGGKSYMKSKVVMLATDKASNLYLTIGDQLHLLSNREVSNGAKGTNQHLYFLSDEEIKVADWYLNLDMRTSEYGVIQVESERLSELATNTPSCKKIIATTDPELNKQIVSDGEYFDSNINHGLPRPSNSFLQKYCELGRIGEVLVEVDVFQSKLYIKPQDTIRFQQKYEKIYQQPYTTNLEEIWDYTIKIAPDNTITIKPLEVKTNWSREEVIDLCNTLFVPSNWNISFDKWIEENLKYNYSGQA